MKIKLILLVMILAFGFMSETHASNDPYDFVAVSPSGHFLRYKINNYDTTSVIVAGHEGDDIWGNLIIPSSVTNNGITYTVNNIGSIAFQYCSISSVTIPNPVSVIGDGAFRRCSNLSSVSLPESLRTILQSAFVQCTSLVTIILPDSLQGVYLQAFYECMGLRKISIPASVNIFAMQAFRACYDLDTIEYRGTIEDWCNITFIDDLSNPLYYGHNLYINGSKVTDMVIPSGVNVIKEYAFNGCNMKNLTISDGVDTIKTSAFDRCDSIKNLYLGDGVKTIGEKAFYGCASIDTIFSYSINPPILSWNTFGGEFDWETWSYKGVADSVPIVIPCGTYEDYQQVWYDFNNFLSDAPSFICSVFSSDSLQGVASANSVNCDSTVTIMAIPYNGYVFVRWNDGNTSNPRVVVLNSDTNFTALFSVDSAVCPMPTSIAVTDLGCGDVEVRVSGVSGSTIRIAYADSTDSYSTDIVDTIYTINGLSSGKTYLISATAICENGELSPSISTTIQPYCNILPDTPSVIHDTLYIFDTTTIVEYVPIHDTVFVSEYIPIHDTTYITSIDTIETTVIDTLFLVETDTIFISVVDSIIMVVHDTVNQIIYDTTTVLETDTLWINDTVFLHDTIYVFDTIVVGMGEACTSTALIYARNDQIVVEGANGENVYLYDVSGKLLATKKDDYGQLTFEIRTTGVYFVKIGTKQARRIVVLR